MHLDRSGPFLTVVRKRCAGGTGLEFTELVRCHKLWVSIEAVRNMVDNIGTMVVVMELGVYRGLVFRWT